LAKALVFTVNDMPKRSVRVAKCWRLRIRALPPHRRRRILHGNGVLIPLTPDIITCVRGSGSRIRIFLFRRQQASSSNIDVPLRRFAYFAHPSFMRLCSSTPISWDVRRRVGIVTSSTASPNMLLLLFRSEPFFSFSPRDQVRYARPGSCLQDGLWVASSRIPYPAGIALVLHDFASNCVCLGVAQHVRTGDAASRA
jgi:hypothetical protein